MIVPLILQFLVDHQSCLVEICDSRTAHRCPLTLLEPVGTTKHDLRVWWTRDKRVILGGKENAGFSLLAELGTWVTEQWTSFRGNPQSGSLKRKILWLNLEGACVFGGVDVYHVRVQQAVRVRNTSSHTRISTQRFSGIQL